MKCAILTALITYPLLVGAAQFRREDPVTRVVGLITELEARIVADGKAEQRVYDRYACWCEDTLSKTSQDIGDGEQKSKDLTALIVKLGAAIATHTAEISQLKKDIQANVESQRGATELREQEHADFLKEKTENENCLGALDAAIKALSGAGTGKKGFLETMQEAELLSVVSGVRGVLDKPAVSNFISKNDVKIVRQFVAQPEEFVSDKSGFLSATQISQAHNPFGDYAPQSTQIQGILKAMQDAFTADLKKLIEVEAESLDSYKELMATKRKEEKTLQLTLDRTTETEANKKLDLANSREDLDDNKAELESNEKFFATAKDGCKTKAGEWAERTRLRTEELNGIQKAIAILTSPESKKTFEGSQNNTFLVQIYSSKSNSRAKLAFQRLKSLAAKFQSLGLAQLAVNARSGWHFDKVIVSIDTMIAELRKEEKEDIEHRDRCQNHDNANTNEIEDIKHNKQKAGQEADKIKTQIEQKEAEITTHNGTITKTDGELADLLGMREADVAEFRQKQKDDMNAVKLLTQAMKHMEKFFKQNNIPLELVQDEPAESNSREPAPETWDEGYTGRKDESVGLIAILSMIREDIEKQIKTSKEEDNRAQSEYEEQRDALRTANANAKKSMADSKRELADLKGDRQENKELDGKLDKSLKTADSVKDAIKLDCSWVKTHFESRRTKRKAEIEGLEQAKAFLAGEMVDDA